MQAHIPLQQMDHLCLPGHGGSSGENETTPPGSPVRCHRIDVDDDGVGGDTVQKHQPREDAWGLLF